MLKEARRLYQFGFAIHWLRPRSKAPVESKWTSGERKTWKYLEETFKPGMNVGVRLGRASRFVIGEEVSYLAVIDCDVKSADPRYAEEMQKRLGELFPEVGLQISGAETTPIVFSGRGNGSAHYYIRTREPSKPKRLAQSPDLVKVKIPSVAPSNRDKENLSPQEITQGLRLRPAWEISLMGEGQQVVLPPSVHPDSGKAYRWAYGLVGASDIPVVEPRGDLEPTERVEASNGAGKKAGGAALPFKFEVEVVDLRCSDLSDRVIGMIETGEGVEDRSGAIFASALALVRSGFSNNEILSVLTDQKNFLGKAAFDHAKTKDRVRAARWIWRYTLEKARSEADARLQFESELEVSSLTEEEIKEQHAALLQFCDWRVYIDRTKDGASPKCTFKNVLWIMENVAFEHGSEELFRYNEFSGALVYGMHTPWGGEVGRSLKDIDLIRMKSYLANTFRIEPALSLISEVANEIGYKNKFHPVRTYLNSLRWDGKPRVDTWLRDHLGGDAPEPYLSAVSRKVLVAMVARVMEPGCKFDQVMILEGFQGKGKSTALRHLAGDQWFTDAHVNFKDKDAVLALQSHWIVELGELSGMRKADVDLLKEFISRQTDKIRVPYGKLPENFPRQCIFIGTTNRDEFLKDETGNRRYWPVRVSRYDFHSIMEVRDQLFAEARVAWEFGEPLYLECEQANAIAVEQQEQRLESDILVEQIANFFEREGKKDPVTEQAFNVEEFTLAEIFADGGPLAGQKDGRPEQLRAAQALRRLGYDKRLVRKGKTVGKLWRKRNPS